MEARRHPIDASRLKKGDTIGVAALERITEEKSGTDRFNLAVMGLVGHIERQFLDRGEVVTVARCKGELVILDDNQAVGHNHQSFLSALRKAARAHKRMMGIDVRELDDDQRIALERNIIVNSKTLQAAMQARRDSLKAIGHTRTTPKLQEPDKRTREED